MFLSRIELDARASEHEAFWRRVSEPYGAHQALWAILSRAPDQKRDFLFRAEEQPGRLSFLVLSAHRPAQPPDGMWRVESKPFAPSLRVGQRLEFRLRASPVVRRGEAVEGKANRRVQRHDVVMHRAKALMLAGEPLPPLADRVRDAGLEWLGRQGERSGFRVVREARAAIGDDGLLDHDHDPEGSLAAVRVDGYRQHRISRRGTKAIRFSTVDFDGLLEVTDPALLVAKVCAGFGPQKAFGCGLMLLRRA